jgi:cell division protein FtsW
VAEHSSKRAPGLRQIDRPLLMVTLLLMSFGLVMVFSSSAFFAQKHTGDQYFFFLRQTGFAAVGLIVMWVVSRFNFQNYKKKEVVYFLYGLSVVMLAAVLIPGVGQVVLGARRWIGIGPFHMQPSEFAKLVLIIYLAYSLTRQRERSTGILYGFLIHLILPSIALILILAEPDFGTFLLVGLVIFLMMFVAGSPIKYPMIALIVLAPAMLVMMKVFPHSMGRMQMWKDQLLFLGSEQDYNLLCYQVRESIISVGSGRLFGLGLGEGTLKMFFLPQAHSDFILATIAQELGFARVLVLFLAFGFMIVRGYQIAFRVPDTFGCFLAFGITSLLMAQFLINTGVVLGLLPPKGIALPFVSYGGSSLIINLMAIGVLLNISRFTVGSGNAARGER